MKRCWMAAVTGLILTGGLTPSSWAAVQVPVEIDRRSRVETIVTDLGNGFYRYTYTVWNDSPAPQRLPRDRVTIWPLIIGWEIPLDSPALVGDITAPETWSWRFLSAEDYVNEYGVENPFDSLYVLQWYDYELFWDISPSKTIAPVGFNAFFGDDEYEPSVNHFSFVSPLSPTDGPYATLWMDLFRDIGDPPLPGGGTVGGLPYTRRHPMPDGGTTAILLGLGLIGLQLWKRIR
jgi:hypothetical protein